MFVEENQNSIHYAKNGITYYFCASQCLNEFVEPEKELKKLKIHEAISIALTIPIIIFSLPHVVPQYEGHLFPMEMMRIYQLYNNGTSNSNSILDWISLL
jgi:Cu+-exporting ATPase